MIRRISSFKMNIIWICLIIIIAFGTNSCLGERANPLKNPHICGRPHCEAENAKFNYAANIRYSYNYSSHIRTEFSGTGQNTSDIYVSGTIVVTFPKKCEGILKITDIELRENSATEVNIEFESDKPLPDTLHAKSTQFASDVQRNDLRFSFHDGLIDELCPEVDEPNWVMNLKRGILSSFQNSMKRFDIDYKSSETDVSGSCDVNYVVNGAQDAKLHITKRKDIGSCRNRYKTNSIIQTTPYDFRKQYSALPILQSISYCNISIDHQVYQEVNCSERHQFVAFSNNGTGAVTTSLITLTLSDEASYTVIEPSSYDDENIIKKREKLLFNHYPTPKHTTGEIRAVRLYLQRMCQYGFPDIKRPFIDAFTKFLQNARLLSSSALHQLFARASSICDKDNGKNHIFESLPFIGTTASVEMMTEEIIKNSVNTDIAQKWLISMSFLPRPDNQMLPSLYKMFKTKHTDSDPTFVFAPTAVVHTYCRNHPNCDENEHVQQFVKLLESVTMQYLKKDLSIRANREKVIVLLRGIGNIGIMSKQFRYNLRQVIYDESIPVEIQVNVIASHRRTDCEQNRDFFLDTYRNMTMLNSEIRIAAYLETIRCSDYLTVKHIKNVLQTEEVNQVGSFVWSHLKNLANSASPIRVAAQSLLVDEDLSNKYHLDFRKFSRNFEHSLFFDEYNVGVNSEANLIFGTDSYLPRSASYNFTVDLFGESVNVFEISAYMQGFEHMVEGIFGPKGPLSTDGFSNKVNKLKQYFKGKVDPYKAEVDRFNMRFRRDSNKGQDESVENIEDEAEYGLQEDEKLDKPNEKRDTNKNHVRDLQDDVKALNFDLKYNMNNPRAAFGLKIFGNDIKYKTLEDLREIYTLLNHLNPENQLKQLLSGKEIIYTKSGVFMEASYEVPLASGFPLALQAYGASSIDLRASGSLKSESFWGNPKFGVRGKLKPSISLQVVATMQSDYYYGSSGIRVRSNLYSSSSVEANLTVNGKNVSLQFGLPQDRNDIISARSELLVLRSHGDVRQPGIQKRYTNSTCMWSGIERALGLKVCSDYSLPDVSKSVSKNVQQLPSLLLCGPIDIEVHIDKADLSAKTFSFEYKWIESANKSSGSFLFETPNTDISRIFSANLTKEPDIYALQMKFENGQTMHSATATYKNTNDEKLVEAHLQIDGHKSFALDMGINKSPIQNGWTFYPKFSLAVNNEQIARVLGTVKKVAKNKITQYDSDFEFGTKKFNGHLSGYVTTTENKFSTRLIANYKFNDSKEERIDFESELEGVQDGYRTSQVGMVKWNSTAYQKYNFKANVNYKRVLGHIDLGININNADDFVDPRYDLGIRIALIKTEPDDKELNSRTNFSIEVTRPISKINYKFMIRYNTKLKRGPMHNVLLLFRYAEGKETTAIISVMLPSVNTRNIDIYMNVAIPEYNSCIARFQAIERTRRQQYDINVEGQWFTGHSIKVYGTYDDKSLVHESRHQLKLLAESPQFRQTSILIKYFLNATMMTIEGDVDYDQNPYGLLIRHNHVSVYEQSVYAELKVLEKHYWISGRLSDEHFRKLAIDLHIDRIREIRFIIGGQSTSQKKEIEAKVSWDSNRDPTQELFLNVEFNTPKFKTYDGGFTISYPQRTFSGSFDLAIPGPTYRGNASIGWRSNETIHLSFDSGAIYDSEKHFWIDVKLKTPFNGWQNNMVEGHAYQAKNQLSCNSTILWAETQKLILGALTDHEFTNEKIKCEAHLLVNSTVKEVPTIDAIFKHNQDERHYTTDIIIRHVAYNRKPDLFGLNSNWHLNFNEFYNNITGSIMLQTPLKGYTKGALATKFSLSSSKTLKGAADFELEQKKFTLAVDGLVKRITDCMLVVNITTPIEKYRNIVSRFGLINRNRHFVAEIRAPSGALGIEVKFAVNSISDFDIIINLETPVEDFKKVMLIGKLTSDTVDFRGGLNRFVLGYIGVSRRATMEDFEYSWKVYTPLDKFEESSLVVKFIRKKMLDMEIMLKFAQKKLGIIVCGKPKQRLIALPTVKHYLPFSSRLVDDFERFNKYFEQESDEDDESEEDELEFESDIMDDWSFVGHMEVNTIIWPEIVGFIDVDDFNEEYYLMRGNLNLPAGNIELNNNLYFPDLLNIRNSLRVNTPFASAKQVELLYLHTAKFGHYYVSAFEAFYKNGSEWSALGFNSNYTKVRDVDLKTHEIEVNLFLPFESLPRVMLGGNIEIADSTYRANISGRTVNTFISLAATLEHDVTDYIDATAGLVLTSLALPYYELKTFFKQDLSGNENSLVFGFKENYNVINEYRAEATWQLEASKFYKFHIKMNTNLFPIYFIESALMLNCSSNFVLIFDLNANTVMKKGIVFHVGAKKRGDRINVEISTPIASLANVSMTGTLHRLTNDALFNLNGRLSRNHDIYNVNGTVGLYSGIPVQVDLRLRPVTRDSTAHFVYTLQMENAKKVIHIRIDEGETYFESDTTVAVNSKLNWDISSSIHTSRGLLSHKPDKNHCSFNALLKPARDGQFDSKIHLVTPWKEFGIDNFNCNGTAHLTSYSGSLQTFYDNGYGSGQAHFSWTFILLENMQTLLDFKAHNPNGLRTLKFGMRYTNPGKSNQRIGIGGNVGVDSKVDLETNCSAIMIGKTDMSGSFAIRLPTPINDVHRFSARYRGDVTVSPIRELMLETRYQSDRERKHFTSRGQYRNGSDLQTLIYAQWGKSDTVNKTFETNLQMLRKNERRELSARVRTPYFVGETIRAGGYYDMNNLYHVFNGSINYPGNREIGSTHIEYSSVANVRGFINCTTPFQNVTWLRTDLNYTTNGGLSRRFVKTSWPSDFAFFDMDSLFDSHNTDRNHQGLINIEVPLTTRHFAQIEYGLKERKTLTNGNCKVTYNEIKVLDGKYQCNTMSRAGFLKDVVVISLDNVRYPIGIAYVHQTEYSAQEFPHTDIKRAEIYDLKNNHRYNITGELHVRTTEMGQAYKIIAIHPNRTVVITSDYDVHDKTVNQRLKLLLSNDTWIAYNFKMTNLSTQTKDSQTFNIDLEYPKRNLSTSGWYSITNDVFDSDLSFKWTQAKIQATETSDYDYDQHTYDENDNENENDKKITNVERIIKAALTWRNEPLNPNDKCNQTILFVIKHPSFKKDITFMANYYRNDIDLLHGKLIVDYHENPSHLVTLEGGIMDSTQLLGHRNYSMYVIGSQEESHFDLYALSSVAAHSSVYETKNFGRYKRGYLPLQGGLLDAGVDFPQNDIHYLKVTPHKTVHIKLRTKVSPHNGEYPIYTINGKYEDSPEINTTADFLLNIDDRFVKFDANFTPEATQNLRLLGIIPDARSASFDLWRDYEDIRIVDVAYYLRMNHSRLITSQLIWRPKLRAEIKNGVHKFSTQMYDSFADNIDFWLKTIYTETIETANDIWTDAKPHTEEFLEDISGLSVIGEDIEEFRKLMNQSYEANDFYIKTVVNFTLTVLDELAIRNHIGSLPKILNEVWQVLGDSGIALRKSILWLIETIKTTYKHTIDALNRIFHGEAMTYMSSLVEKALYKYDRFIKDLHLSFIKYVQNIWNIISDTLMDYWRRLLEKIQPMVMRFIHYAETLLWNISQEIFEFLHKHTNDLTQSPYFDTVSEFMRDLDTVYQDIQNNDAITNIKKYSTLASAFLREKYFKVVPFGRELQNLINELIDEIKGMRKQEHIQYVINRIDEWNAKLVWLAEEFQLDRRLHQLWQIVLNKITSYEQTALQMDDKYREAKTKFLFDPNQGIVKYEQKLPFSWHSFNETPMFEEISELRMLTKVFRIFKGVNISVMPFDVLQYYANPYVWLPPFKARSLLVGSRHYITFDKRFVSLNHKYAIIKGNEKPDQCSYLLANDFVDSNFTLVQEPSTARFDGKLLSTRKLTMISDGNIIDIDMVANAIYINRTTATALPIQIGDTIIYREWDNLIIHSKNGFELNCNIQFDFCWFEVSGWHFGKTAGVTGTMNNEINDDFLTSKHHITTDINEFRQSWALNECKHTFQKDSDNSISVELLNICDTYFQSKVSSFSNCFATIEPKPFYDMCLDMGSNSITNFTHIDHPAQKGACAVAMAYMESCAEQNLPLRVPEMCLHCNLINGSYVAEGSIFELNGDNVPKTTDVVFIIEAKHCNHNFTVNKNIQVVIAAMEKAFAEVDLHDIRYAVVVFGGDAPFDSANSIVYNNKIFTDNNHIRYHFGHIKTGHSNSSDISRAIKVASELVFRPGASKQFILMPCSNCNVNGMHFDYSTVLQFLWEHNINLHIFMNGNFETKKPRMDQKIFGFDNAHVYTNDYLKENVGKKELRSEIILPKNTLGFCMVWALETNGTIFTANKLRPNARTSIKKFSTVFAKRIAKTAIPSPCQLCECTGENTGVAYVTCTSCDFPNAFEEEDLNTIFDGKDFPDIDGENTDAEDE